MPKMKRVFLLLAALMVVPQTSVASKKTAKPLVRTSSTERTLSYYQWASLSSKQRIKYQSNLKSIHLKWEEHQAFYKISEAQVDPAHRWAILLEIMQLPQAVAADPSDCSRVNFYMKQSDVGDTFELCAKKRIRLIGIRGSENCIGESNLPGEWAVRCQSRFADFIRTERSPLRDNSQQLLVDLASYESRFLLNSTPTAPAQASASAQPAAPAPSGSATTSSQAASSARLQEIHDAMDRPPVSPFSLEAPYTSGSPAASNASTSAAPAADSAASSSTTPPTSAATGTASPASPQCQALGSSCGSSRQLNNVEALRQAYRKDMEKLNVGEQPCVIAGFVSNLNAQKKCLPVTTLGIGSAWRGSCNSGQTMCNPLMFGFHEDGAALCVPLGQHVTSQCVLKARDIGNTESKVADQILGKSNIPELANITTDDFADLWQKHRQGLAKLCVGRTNTTAFFCTECTAMNNQIRLMNMQTTCADACGQVATDDVSACKETYKTRSNSGSAPSSGTR